MTNNNFYNTIRISGGEYSNHDYSLPELMDTLLRNPIVETIKNGALSEVYRSIEDVLSLPNFRNKTFESIYHVARGIAEEIIKNDADVGEVIPRKIHHYWSGEEMSEIAMENILKWQAKSKAHNWEHFVWTDSTANKFYNNDGSRMSELQEAGIEIMDFPQLLLETGEDVQKAYNILVNKAYCKRKKSLLFMSDLARCTVLYHYGGVYCDVDVAPHKVSLEKSLKHRDAESTIPMLGPCFRTERDAKAAGYLDISPGAKEAACLRMYNRSIFGNHFIATRAGTDVMKHALENTNKSLQISNYNATLGPGDIIKAMYTQNNNTKITSAQAIPPWLFDINWITKESNNIVL
jgi:mannosyltransferase OCH1-like enzyme